MRIKSRTVAVAVLLPLLILTGCAIKSPGAGASKRFSQVLLPTTTTIPWTWPPNLMAVGPDVDAATSITAKQTDFPAGWNENSNAPTSAPDLAVLDEAFVQCLFGASPSELTAYVVSPVMAAPTGIEIAQSFVRAVGSTADARSDFSNFKPARVSDCETAMYTRQFNLPPNTKIIGKIYGFDPPDSIPAETILPPDGSLDVIGIRFLVAPRDAPQIFEDVFAYGVGRFEVVELFQNSKNNPDPNDESGALQAIKSRANTVGKSTQ